eukprot:COSAG01_NODE_58515_length_305_cov_1.475728_2_plen_40_part_01
MFGWSDVRPVSKIFSNVKTANHTMTAENLLAQKRKLKVLP